MVDEEIVMDTIKKMKDSGLEDSIIVSTLQDIGLSEEEARDYIERVASGKIKPMPPEPREPKPAAQPSEKPTPKTPAPQPTETTTKTVPAPTPAPQQARQPKPAEQAAPPPPQQQVSPKQIADQTAQQVRYHLAEQAEGEEMRHAATQAMLSEQQKTMDEIGKRVKKIEKKTPLKLPPDTSPQIRILMREMETIRKELEETRALSKSTYTLMEKILEVNRKILGRLP